MCKHPDLVLLKTFINYLKYGPVHAIDVSDYLDPGKLFWRKD